MMNKNFSIKSKGTVVEKLPNDFFRVKLEENGWLIIAKVANNCTQETNNNLKKKRHKVRIWPWDKVLVGIPPGQSDPEQIRGLIIHRLG